MIAEETLRVTLGTKKLIEGLEAGLYKYQGNETGYIIISPRLGTHSLITYSSYILHVITQHMVKQVDCH